MSDPGCIGKDRLTHEQAMRIVGRQKRGPATSCAYRCASCGSWHVGHQARKPPKLRRRA